MNGIVIEPTNNNTPAMGTVIPQGYGRPSDGYTIKASSTNAAARISNAISSAINTATATINSLKQTVGKSRPSASVIQYANHPHLSTLANRICNVVSSLIKSGITALNNQIEDASVSMQQFVRGIGTSELLGKHAPMTSLKDAPDMLKNNKEYVLRAVSQNGFELEHASEDLKDDREVVEAAMKQAPTAILFASKNILERTDLPCEVLRTGQLSLARFPEVQNNKKAVLAAIERDALQLQYAAEFLRKDPEVVLTAMRKNPAAVEYGSASLIDNRKFYNEARKILDANKQLLMSGYKQLYTIRYREA